MGRMIITEKDIQKTVDVFAKPFEDTARAMGLQKEVLDIRAAVSTPVPKPDDYQSRLLKYIPAEVVAVYLTLEGIVKSAADQQIWLLWVIFGLLLIGTPLYLWRVAKVPRKVQLSISTIAFAVWIFALGGPFASQTWYEPVYGAILLPIYTFFVPIIIGGD